MRLPEKDKRALNIMSRSAKCNMAILAVERRFDLLPKSLRQSGKGKKLQRIFAKRDVLEDKGIGENPRATDLRFVNMATNRRNIYLKAFLPLIRDSDALITELESLAWRDEHPAS